MRMLRLYVSRFRDEFNAKQELNFMLLISISFSVQLALAALSPSETNP